MKSVNFCIYSLLALLNNNCYGEELLNTTIVQTYHQISNNINCEPPKILNGKYTVYSKNYTTELQIPNFASVIITCDKNYGLYPAANKYIVCVHGTWKRSVPECVRTCPSLRSESVDFECILNNQPQNCYENVLENTVVTMKCKPHYYLSHMNSSNTIMECKNGKWNQNIITCAPECGQQYTSILEPFIVNGKSAKHGNFPWHVAIYKNSNKNSEPSYICGGSIISTHIVLSAAHCFTYNDNGKLMDISQYIVCANKFYSNFSSPLDVHVQKRAITKIEIPAGYRGEISVFARDIAVLIIEKPFILTNNVKPVCVDWDALFEIEQLIHLNNGQVAGWGYETNKSISGSDGLNALTVPYIDTNLCIETVPENFIKYITPDKFCGGYTNGSGVCNGDSGGGIVFERKENIKSIFYIRGIVSLGPIKEGYCDHFQYSVYTKISHYINFIKDVVALSKELSPEDCIYPNMTNGKFLISDHIFKIGDRVPNNSSGIFECDEQYELFPYIRHSTCKNGNWSTIIPACVRSNDCQVKYNNKPGQCTLLKHCPEALVELKLGKRPHLCGLEGVEPVVCCSKSNSIAENSQRISRKMCEEYSRRVYEIGNNTSKCSSNTQTLYSDVSSAAHIGLIGFDHKRAIKWRCSGVLISDQYFLAPAHCCFDKPFSPAVVVRLGVKSINSTEEETRYMQDIKIIDVFLHPALNSTQQYNDIALLKLEKSVELNEHVRPACLPILNYVHNDSENIVTGWPLKDTKLSRSACISHTKKVQFLTYENCSEKISFHRHFKKGIDSDTQFCVEDTDEMCKLVGGAALQIYDQNIYCMYYIIGLYSFGESTCLPEPNVFTKIAPYIDWIESIVWP